MQNNRYFVLVRLKQVKALIVILEKNSYKNLIICSTYTSFIKMITSKRLINKHYTSPRLYRNIKEKNPSFTVLKADTHGLLLLLI